MKILDDLLRGILHISEGKPYSATIKVADPEGKLELPGDVIFRLERGRLNFDFYPSNPIAGIGDPQAYIVFGKSKQEGISTILSIPDRGFEYAIVLENLPLDRSMMRGTITEQYFGSNETSITSVSTLIRYLPNGWHIDNLKYYSGYDPERLGVTLLSAMTLNADGWLIRLQELTTRLDESDEVTHVMILSRDDRVQFTGIESYDILADIRPFLSFIFGQQVEFTISVGSRYGDLDLPDHRWGYLFPHQKTGLVNQKLNWFFTSNPTQSNLNDMYKAYRAIPY